MNQGRRKQRIALWIVCMAVVGAALVLGWRRHRAWEYGLPVLPGDSADSVRRVLGVASFTFADPKIGTRSTSTFLTHGIEGTFEDGQLFRITIPNQTANGVEVSTRDIQQGLLPYSGVIVKGLRITDSKQKILQTLGKPTKIECDDLAVGTNPDIPVVWPAGCSYYWRFPDYVVEADFLNQAQSVDEASHLTLPKDYVISFQITK